MFQYSSLYFWLGLLLSIVTLGLAKKQKDTRRLSSRFIISKPQDMHYMKDKHIIIVVQLFLSLLGFESRNACMVLERLLCNPKDMHCTWACRWDPDMPPSKAA